MQYSGSKLLKKMRLKLGVIFAFFLNTLDLSQEASLAFNFFLQPLDLSQKASLAIFYYPLTLHDSKRWLESRKKALKQHGKL